MTRFSRQTFEADKHRQLVCRATATIDEIPGYVSLVKTYKLREQRRKVSRATPVGQNGSESDTIRRDNTRRMALAHLSMVEESKIGKTGNCTTFAVVERSKSAVLLSSPWVFSAATEKGGTLGMC